MFNPILIQANMTHNKLSKFHVAMFPWVAFGHFIPYLHLSNKLAERGHRVSFLLPKGAKTKLEELSQYPDLIHFFPLVIPHIDGLPLGAETTADVPFPLEIHLVSAFDQTREQVESILNAIKPDFVFYDFGHWIPALTRKMGTTKAIYNAAASAAVHSLCSSPAKKITKDMSLEEIIKAPPGYPSLLVRLKAEEAATAKIFVRESACGSSFYERLVTSRKESDALAMRTCREIEGAYCDYLAQQYAKPVLLTGPVLPETQATQLEEKWAKWLGNFESSSVVFCAFGSQTVLQKDQFQELLLGFELSMLPFLVALMPPQGCTAIDEALPEGFQGRVQGRGWVYGGWVPQTLILEHPSVGCFVSHCGFGSMWESLLSDSQIVLIPQMYDQIVNTRLMVEELKVAVEVERGENRWISKESLSRAIKLVMDKDSDVAGSVKKNHAKLKKTLSSKILQEEYINNFIQSLQDLLE